VGVTQFHSGTTQGNDENEEEEKKRGGAEGVLASSEGMYATIRENGRGIWNSHRDNLIHRLEPLMFELVMFQNGRDLDSVAASTLTFELQRKDL
jgi:hypothetical protein